MGKLQWFTMDGNEWPECQKCLDRMTDPLTISACASVGIEHGRSTHEMMRGHLDHYHQRGHR